MSRGREVVPDLPMSRRGPSSRFTTRSPAAWLLVLSAGCLPGAADRPTDGDQRPHRLAGPGLEFPAPFTSIRAVLALQDGRLLVSDPRENRVLLIDFVDGSTRLLGSLGEGPREFRRAGGLYRGRRGSVLIFDQALRRLLPVLPSGDLDDVVAAAGWGPGGSWSARGPDVLSFDSLGNAYGAMREGDLTAPTSVLLRYRPGGQVDTVTHLRRAETMALRGGGNGMEYQDVLFSPEDAWTVAPDGRIAVVRADPYRTEWIPPVGPRVTGPVIRHARISVSEREKELIASGAAGPRGRTRVTMAVAPPGGQPSAAPGGPSPMRVDELLFARWKTPINLRTGGWPVIDEAGRLWVERSLAGEAAAKVFDVFDDAGELIERMELPAGLRLVGFDSQWVYCARSDQDGFEYLKRFPAPS